MYIVHYLYCKNILILKSKLKLKRLNSSHLTLKDNTLIKWLVVKFLMLMLEIAQILVYLPTYVYLTYEFDYSRKAYFNSGEILC